MIHIPCYTYDTSTVTLGSRTPHLPNGAFCSHSGPLWKDPTKDGPRARPSFIFQAFCHWEKAAGTSVKLSENGWKIHLFQQIFADRSAICSANYKFTKTQMRKLSDRLRWLTWTGFFFFFSPASLSREISACRVREHCILKWWRSQRSENGGTVHPLHFYRPTLHSGFKWVKWRVT